MIPTNFVQDSGVIRQSILPLRKAYYALPLVDISRSGHRLNMVSVINVTLSCTTNLPCAFAGRAVGSYGLPFDSGRTVSFSEQTKTYNLDHLMVVD